MKKVLLTLFILILALSMLGLFACGSHDNSGSMDDNDSEESKHTHNYVETIVEPTYSEKGYTLHTCSCGDTYKDNYTEKLVSGISFKTLTLNNDDTVYGKVANGTSTFSFLNEITVNGSVTYKVSMDIYGKQDVPNKTVNLNTGDNTFYVLADNTENGLVLYTVTIRVKPLYTVSFNTLGGNNIDSQTIEEDSLATMPSTPTKTGYTFKGWNYNFNTPITSAKTITVNEWSANTYTVSFDGNGVENPNDITVTYDNTYSNLPTLERTGYIFKGWYFGQTKIENGYWRIDENITVVAKWEQIISSYLVRFDSNGGEGFVPTQEFTYNVSQNLNINTFTKYGYTFNGWMHNGETYEDEENVLNLTIDSPEITLKAQWIEDCSYTLSGGEYYVSGLHSNSKTNAEILAEYNKKPVRKIGESAFAYKNNLESIVIPYGVTSVGQYAFEGCINLKNIIIPDTILRVDYGAFFDCDNLLYNTYNNGLYLGNNINLYLILIKTISVDVTNCTINEKCKIIYDAALSDCVNLTQIIIPSKVTSIGVHAFSGCENLYEVIIPFSTTRLGAYVFYNCSKLSNIKFNDETNWYRVDRLTAWYNNMNGISMDLSTPANNATYFKDIYYSYYWYKI